MQENTQRNRKPFSSRGSAEIESTNLAWDLLWAQRGAEAVAAVGVTANAMGVEWPPKHGTIGADLNIGNE